MARNKRQVAHFHPVVCHAPPLTDELLQRYADLVVHAPIPPRTRDAINICLECVLAWWNVPESTERGDVWESRTADGRKLTFDEVPFSEDLIATLDLQTPWLEECQMYQQLFDALPTGRQGDGPVTDQAACELRNAAFHLLWHALEITHDREPLTSDKLRG